VKITVSTEQLATNSETPPRQHRLFCRIWRGLANSACRNLPLIPVSAYRPILSLSGLGRSWYGVGWGLVSEGYGVVTLSVEKASEKYDQSLLLLFREIILYARQ